MIRETRLIPNLADAITPDFVHMLTQVRRHIHEHPELSFQEFETSAYIREQLEQLGIPYRVVATTGIVATIGSGEKCVALRADIDALPITEETGLPFASARGGVMHACGHDMHTTMLLGAAHLLKAHEPHLGGTVLLLFQPGEEKTPGGASIMIREGALANPVPQMMFGQHVDPDATVGQISFVSGPMMASADELSWTIRGHGAHAAQPHKGRDPLFAAAGLVHHLQGVFNRRRDPLKPSVLTVTSIHGGSAFNVIPETVQMMGTLRSFDQAWREEAWELLEQQTREYCALHGCEGMLEIGKGYPSLVNDADAIAFARAVAEQQFGAANVLDFERKMWAEDFAYYAQQVPSCFWMLGARPKGLDSMPGLHHPQFTPDEQTLVIGARMMAAVAIKFLLPTNQSDG
jgi:hippurate hydrolase